MSSKVVEWVSYKGDILTRPEDVAGYSMLSDTNRELFESFLNNFYKAWEYPEYHVPIKVRYIVKENYLRVDFKKRDTKYKYWFHVKNSTTWY